MPVVLPMFPLGTVLFPSVFLPLHVFEDRYRALVEHCLADGTEPEFGVVLIERGSEVGGGDVRSMVGTVARIVEAAQAPDGRWALGTVGTRRFRVVRWLEDAPYPHAEVEEWPDPAPAPTLAEEVAAATGALRRVLALAAELGDPVAPATFTLSEDPALASYQLAAVAPVGPIDRQALLAAPGTHERVAAVAALVEEEASVLMARVALPPG